MYKIVAHIVITLSAETECDGFGTGVAICIIGEQSRSADVGFVAQEVIVHQVDRWRRQRLLRRSRR